MWVILIYIIDIIYFTSYQLKYSTDHRYYLMNYSSLTPAVTPLECERLEADMLAELEKFIVAINKFLKESWPNKMKQASAVCNFAYSNQPNYVITYAIKHFEHAGWRVTNHHDQRESYLAITKVVDNSGYYEDR